MDTMSKRTYASIWTWRPYHPHSVGRVSPVPDPIVSEVYARHHFDASPVPALRLQRWAGLLALRGGRFQPGLPSRSWLTWEWRRTIGLARFAIRSPWGQLWRGGMTRRHWLPHLRETSGTNPPPPSPATATPPTRSHWSMGERMPAGQPTSITILPKGPRSR